MRACGVKALHSAPHPWTHLCLEDDEDEDDEIVLMNWFESSEK
jgi:hypothetical protein